MALFHIKIPEGYDFELSMRQQVASSATYISRSHPVCPADSLSNLRHKNSFCSLQRERLVTTFVVTVSGVLDSEIKPHKLMRKSDSDSPSFRLSLLGKQPRSPGVRARQMSKKRI